jgi:hypothetical protein
MTVQISAMPTLSQPIRRLAAVGLLLVVVTLAALLTVVPMLTHVAELRDQIDTERALLGRLAAAVSQESRIADYEKIGQAALQSSAYLTGESEALMAAALQTTLAQLGSAHRVRFSSTRALPAHERDGIRLIGVNLQFRGEIEQLRALLFRIEAHRPFLFVEGLQVRPVSPFSQKEAEFNGLLEVRLDVFGAVPGGKKG